MWFGFFVLFFSCFFTKEGTVTACKLKREAWPPFLLLILQYYLKYLYLMQPSFNSIAFKNGGLFYFYENCISLKTLWIKFISQPNYFY